MPHGSIRFWVRNFAMKIYVCVKHVPDTAARITVVEGTGFAETCKFIVNPYDEYAVEEAVQLVKQAGAGEVVIVTVGRESAVTTMRAALALGADRGILIKTDFQFLDSAITGRALQKAIEQDGSPDLIFCGKQARRIIIPRSSQLPYCKAHQGATAFPILTVTSSLRPTSSAVLIADAETLTLPADARGNLRFS